MSHTAQSKAFSPIYVLQAGEACPECGKATNAYALLASALYDVPEGDTFPVPIILKEIERLPKRTLALLQHCCPNWRFDREQHGQPPYLMNHCHRCGAKLTEHYLHAEPGSAFYPCGPDECWNIGVFAVQAGGPVSMTCSFTAGGLTDWLDYSKAQPLLAF